jgi:hypothetical protein
VCMSSKRPSSRSSKPRGPSRLSEDAKAAIEKTAGGFGLSKARPGQAFDEKYNAGKESGSSPRPFTPPGYKDLVTLVGARNLEVAETGVFWLLVMVFSAFLLSGLAMSSLAYFKATSTEPPPGFEEFISSKVEGLFSPSLIVFFALSTIYGLYKQAQLNSGVTSFTELSDDEKNL